MLKHSETIINSSVRRQDITWDYRWDFHNQDDPNTIFLRPEMKNSSDDNNTTWYFNGDANELRKYDEYTWDPNNPVFEYHVQEPEPIGTKTEDDPEGETGQGPNEFTEYWDDSHPYNKTRYLRPSDNNFIRITNTVQNVTIDPIPPAFISDYGTEYLALECNFEDSVKKGKKNLYYTNSLRDIVVEFKDEVGLDYRQIALIKGDNIPDWGNFSAYDENFIPTDHNIIYYFDRNLAQPAKQEYVNNIKFNATKLGQYQVKFTLHEKWATKDNTGYNEIGNILDILNKNDKSDISLIVWDIAGNYSVYKFQRAFKTLAIDDLNKLVPVVINFVDIEPNNYFLEDGVEGKIITTVQDPNEVLWEYENLFGLTEESIGIIDKNAIESNLDHNPLDGLSKFIITSLKESGNVEVEAWVETGFPEIDELIKERTYNTAICGPWVYGDEGRKYKLTPYVPKYLHGTEFADFMEFFQLYINTMYKGLDNNRNISGLEKIARIGNFNDIARLEDSLVYHYAKEFGNEFDFDVKSLQEVNLILNGEGFTTRDTKETFEIIKYVLEQLPAYNKYKGTNTGIEMAIKMFGFSCRIINIWVNRVNEIEINPDFIEETGMYNTNDYFMTSRFNLNLEGKNNTFKTFCDNIDMFISLIKSIKPITKILNAIKYTITLSKDINLVYKIDEVNDDKVVTYNLTWKLDKDHLEDTYVMKQLCKVNPTTGYVNIFGLNYTPECTVTSGNETIPIPTEIFNEIGDFLKHTNNGVTFKVTKDGTEQEFTFTQFESMLNAGGFYLSLKKSDKTVAKTLIDFLNLDEIIADASKKEPEGKSVTITTSFTLIPGTEYAKCEI